MKREIKDFWTYDEVLDVFNYMSRDLTYAELKLLISVMKLNLLFKNKERTGKNVWCSTNFYDRVCQMVTCLNMLNISI